MIAAALACAWRPLAAAEENADGMSLHLAGLTFSEDGNLIGWKVERSGGTIFELIEQGKSLIEFRLLVTGEDVSDGIVWRRLEPNGEHLARFVGTHVDAGVEVRRYYSRGAASGTILHATQLVSSSAGPAGDLRGLVRIFPGLARHTVNDGSLGDWFYGYSRTFAVRSRVGGFEPVSEKGSATSAAIVVRHVAVVIEPDFRISGQMEVDASSGVTVTLLDCADTSSCGLELRAVSLSSASVADGEYANLIYPEMARPLRALALVIDETLHVLNGIVRNPGVVIVLFAVALRVALLPLNLWSIRQQRHFSDIQRRMKPRIDQIGATKKGAEKNEQILHVYKEFGISPFSGLKSSIGLFVQLPILIALFAVTTESALFRDVPFLWAADLSLPDRAYALPFTVPGLGSHVNVLPLLLGAVCVFAAVVQVKTTRDGSPSEVPRSGLLLALAFVIFFYSCAAALVLYWTAVNALQIIEGQFAARRTPPAE